MAFQENIGLEAVETESLAEAQSVAVLTEGGLRSIGSVNTTGKTIVQWDKGGVRMESVQQWNGHRSMKSGTGPLPLPRPS